MSQVGILVPSRVFYLQELDKPFPAHYRLATRQDVKLNTRSLWESMPAWEIAHLADGWAEGKGYGGKTGYVAEACDALPCPNVKLGRVWDKPYPICKPSW